MIAIQTLHIITFLVFYEIVNAKTDKFYNARYLETRPESDSNFYISETILNVGLDSCIEACKATKECRYINYHKDALACHFIGVQGEHGSMMTHNLIKEKGYTFGNKSEWNLERYNVCSECQDQGSCKREKLENEHHDRYSVCRNSGCGPPPEFEGSTIRGNMYSIGYRVLYECDHGYVTTGHAISTCLENGTWSLSKSVCLQNDNLKDCGALPSVSDGSVALDATTSTFGSTATLTCDSGYDASQASISCQASGSWQVPTCTIKDCGALPSVSDGSVALDATTSTFGSTATLTCDSGYDASQASISCQASGSWQIPTCTIKDCGALPSASDGSVALDGTTSTFGSTATLTCDSGYDASQASISCQASGTWQVPTCTIQDCGALPSVSDGSVALDATTSTFGSTATLTCDSGYDASQASISCQASGSWQVPTCTIKDCGALPSVSDGSVALDATTSTFGSTATLTCDSGYDASQASISCQASGSWQIPTCTIKDCGALPSASDGSVALDGTTSTFGSTATLTCDSGYDASQASISCQASGTWQVPTCTIQDCGALPSVSDGSVALDATTSTFGSTATLTCDSGYDASQASISCQASGSWQVPTCTIKDCGALPSVSDGSVALDATTSTFGSTATLTCDSGYDASQASISCQASGSWQIPTCTIKDCGALPSASDGSVALDGTTSTFGSTATLTCDSGYDASQASISCQASGTWQVPTCTIQDCGALPSVSDGSVALDATTSTFGSTATLNCDSGYDASQASISCQASGSWQVPTCTIKDCGALPSVSDGSVALDATTSTFGSTATVSCDSGYDASQASISCQASGSWQVPTCTIKVCGNTFPIITTPGQPWKEAPDLFKIDACCVLDLDTTGAGTSFLPRTVDIRLDLNTEISAITEWYFKLINTSLPSASLFMTNMYYIHMDQLPFKLKFHMTYPAENPKPTGTCNYPASGIVYNLYEVLCKSILFYEAQRSGKLPADQRVTWRRNSTLTDGSDNGVDLTGGWFNRGGIVKSTYPMASSTTILLWGLWKWSSSYTAAGQLTYMYDSVRWPLDYFLKCWKPDQERFYVQVEDNFSERQSYFVNSSNGGSDVAGDTVSALALGYMVFKDTDSTYANTLLGASKSLFEFANNYRKQYSDSILADQKGYRTSTGDSFGDELTQAALWLYKATEDETYLSKAKDLYKEFQSHFDEPPMSYDWKDKRVAVNMLMFEETEDSLYSDRVKSFLQFWSPNGNVSYTANGLAWLNETAPLRYVSNVAFMSMLALNKTIISSSNISAGNVLDPYKQIKYILGDSGRSYVVGFGTNFPKNPRHKSSICPPQGTSCDWTTFNDTNHFILFGALVGGPDKHDNFQDDRRNKLQNSVACHLNAGFQSAVAGIIAIPEGSQ